MVHRTLSARESLYYTWDDPLGKKAIRWDFPAAKIHKKKKKPISVTKVRRDWTSLVVTVSYATYRMVREISS